MKHRFPVIMKLTAAITFVAALVCFFAFYLLRKAWLLSLAITFFTTCYHFSIRLLIGRLVPNKFDFHAKWFQPRSFEPALYQKLRLRKWKKYIPTYNPDSFSLSGNSPEQILQNMCQAEVVHLLIIAASFLPLLLSFLWGSFGVFLVTSLISAAIDLIFVMAQRYNRPRFVHLLAKIHREA